MVESSNALELGFFSSLLTRRYRAPLHKRSAAIQGNTHEMSSVHPWIATTSMTGR